MTWHLRKPGGMQRGRALMLCCRARRQGNVQMRLGQFGRALASYRRAADLAPGVRAHAPGSVTQRMCSMPVCTTGMHATRMAVAVQ